MQTTQQDKKLRSLQEAYLQHIYLLKKVTEHEPDINNSLKMMYLLYSTRIIESSDTLLLLSVHNKLNDAYAIARMVLELSTNLTFIASKPNELIVKSLEYAHQKMYRDLDRNLKIGNLNFGVKFNNVDAIIMTDKLENSITKFTDEKTGEEIRDWTGVDKKTITQKIEKITEEFGDGVGLAFVAPMFVVYRYSSEILHGTTFGAMYSLGLTKMKHETPNTAEEVKHFQDRTLSNIILSFNLLLNCVIKVYLQKFPNEDFEKERQALNDLVRNENGT
jgi:Family of unknown function (DUF5677)